MAMSIQQSDPAPRDSSGTLADELRRVNERLLLSSLREQESAEVSEQKRAQLNALLEALSEGVAMADATGRLLMLNAAARRIVGIDAAIPSTTDPFDALDLRHPNSTPLAADERPLRRAVRGEHFVDVEILIVRADGETRQTMMSGTSVLDGDSVALAIVVLRDITEMRLLERQREEYLALISHDLRGPLSAVALLAGSLKRLATDEGLSERVVDRVARIERNATRMTTMLSELVESASLELDATARTRERCVLSEMIAGAIDRLDDARRARVEFDAGDDACTVLAEPAAIERAFTNLLANALKYSDTSVLVRLQRRGDEALVEVIDHGIGIAPDTVPRLFQRYYRTPIGREYAGGLGLGLYITRLIVEAHGGHVEVKSELGRGSTLSLVLPLDTSPG